MQEIVESLPKERIRVVSPPAAICGVLGLRKPAGEEALLGDLLCVCRYSPVLRCPLWTVLLQAIRFVLIPENYLTLSWNISKIQVIKLSIKAFLSKAP